MGARGADRAGYARGGRGAVSCVYRNELRLDLKQPSDSAVTTSWGSPFQSGMVLNQSHRTEQTYGVTVQVTAPHTPVTGELCCLLCVFVCFVVL